MQDGPDRTTLRDPILGTIHSPILERLARGSVVVDEEDLRRDGASLGVVAELGKEGVHVRLDRPPVGGGELLRQQPAPA